MYKAVLPTSFSLSRHPSYLFAADPVATYRFYAQIRTLLDKFSSAASFWFKPSWIQWINSSGCTDFLILIPVIKSVRALLYYWYIPIFHIHTEIRTHKEQNSMPIILVLNSFSLVKKRNFLHGFIRILKLSSSIVEQCIPHFISKFFPWFILRERLTEGASDNQNKLHNSLNPYSGPNLPFTTDLAIHIISFNESITYAFMRKPSRNSDLFL